MKKEEVKLILEKNARIIYFDRSSTLEELNNIEQYMNLFSPAYELFRQAIIASVIKDSSGTFVLLDEAIKVAINSNDTYLIQEISMFKGVLNRSLDDHDESFKNYITALKYGDHPRAYNNIADIYLMIGDYEEAKLFLAKGLNFLLKIENLSFVEERLLNIIYTNMSEAELKTGNITEGIRIAKKCIERSLNLNDVFTEAFGYSLLGTADMLRENYESALNNFEYAHQLYLGCDAISQIRVLNYIEENTRFVSDCLSKWGKHALSNERISHIRNYNNNDYELLIHNYEALGDIDHVNQSYRNYVHHIKEVDSNQKKIKIDHFKTKIKVFETEKKANDYELLYNHTVSVSNIGREIVAAKKLDDVLNALQVHIDKIMDFTTLGLAVVKNDKIYYNWVIENGQRIPNFVVDVNDMNSFSSWAVRNKKPIRLNDALTEEELSKYKEVAGQVTYGLAMDSMIMSPIIYKDHVYGMINVQTNTSYAYSEYDLEVINMLSSFIAIAMKNWQSNALLLKANEKLNELSTTDALTGISNRHVLSEIVENIFTADNSDNIISIVMIDVDHFKEYNDTYGHIEGDRCLVKLVDAMSKHLNHGEFKLFRYGGDEFAGILPHISSEEVRELLEVTRLEIEGLKLPHSQSSVSDVVTCSFGFTTVTKGLTEYQKAFYLADEALYMAKASGKNQIAFKKE